VDASRGFEGAAEIAGVNAGLEAVFPESGVKRAISGVERLEPVDLAEYVVDQVS
jgi:hypothetical protein